MSAHTDSATFNRRSSTPSRRAWEETGEKPPAGDSQNDLNKNVADGNKSVRQERTGSEGQKTMSSMESNGSTEVRLRSVEVGVEENANIKTSKGEIVEVCRQKVFLFVFNIVSIPLAISQQQNYREEFSCTFVETTGQELLRESEKRIVLFT